MRISAGFLLFLTLGATIPAFAQDEFGILDNSFLVEEAFNQEAGIFQNIFNYRWQRGEWLATFTQEWPIGGMTHQLSFTIPFGSVDHHASVGDALVNYRLQVLRESATRPAFAPRISLIVPSSPKDSGLGRGVVGWQINLPFSKRAGDWYLHWNAGLTYLPGNRGRYGPDADALASPFAAGSVIWQASRTLNFLVELVAESIASPESDGRSERESQLTVSPGLRHAWNLGDKQIVIGLAARVSRRNQVNRASVFGYFSYELPFK